MSYTYTTPIRYVRGIGPNRAKELVACGITTVGDLLERRPLSYVYPGMTPIADATDGMVVVRARIKDVMRGCWGSTVEAVLDDETGVCKAMWYNSPYLLSSLHSGMTAIFYGKMKGGVLSQPRWTTVSSTMKNIYGGQYGEKHHQTIRAALVEVLGDVQLPEMHGGLNRTKVFRVFHFPADREEQQRAEYTLKFDECIQLQLSLSERRKRQESVRGKVIWI